MARHIFKPWPEDSPDYWQSPLIVRSISLCGCVVSTREPENATDGQHARAGDCQECIRLAISGAGDGAVHPVQPAPED